MSEQDGTQVTTIQRPHTTDLKGWKAYWKVQGQPWRTEPEIDEARQNYLAERRSITSDIEQGIYPFKDIKLSRADVEWLLATHENGRGPVDWSDVSQREREGLDVRGADLRNVNLQCLPLTCLRGGATLKEWMSATEEQTTMAAVLMTDANLSEAHLEGARLYKAHLEGVDLYKAHLERAILIRAHMESAFLWETYLVRTDLRRAHLEGIYFERTTFSDEKHIGPRLADAHWGGVNLTVVEWSKVNMLGDEYEARQKQRRSVKKDRTIRLREYGRAARANRQLALVMQSQGLNAAARRFSYRAQVLEKSVLWFQMLQSEMKLKQRIRAIGAWLFSWFLFLLAGYGYKPARSFLAYLLVITAFATVYFIIGHTVGPALSPLGAWVFSMTSFHGRGFFPGGIKLDDPLTGLAGLEAFIGLLIEVTFIATLTQRFFGK